MKKYNEKKTDEFENLHGKDLVDAIMNSGIKWPTPEEMEISRRQYAEQEAKERRRRERFESILDVLRPIFFTPLAFVFHVITFIARIVAGVSCVAMLYGFYCVYKAVTEWRAGLAYGDDAKTAVILIICPFVAYAVVMVAEKAWAYFENNKW
ncbi:MAG: hypothetical protein LUE24_13370 [Lachnospiraceae bacterium]|nr:hypothetical protein [Lachnospiraceae bacterium]